MRHQTLRFKNLKTWIGQINEDEKICLQNEVINDSNEEIFHARLSSHLNKSQ